MWCSGLCSRDGKNCGRGRPWIKLLRVQYSLADVSRWNTVSSGRKLPPKEGVFYTMMSAGMSDANK
jgi:hypothetical protein